MELATAVNDYLQYAKHEQKVARTTYLTYASWLHSFEKWLVGNGYPDPTLDVLNPPLLRRYLYSLSEKGLRPRSIRSCFFPIRNLCKFLVKTKVLKENPMEEIDMPKKDAAIRATSTDIEIGAVMAACEKLSDIREITLTRAILSVFVYGGLRRTELCDLKTDDIDLNDGSLIVRNGKGAKARKIFLCRECLDALREWMVLRAKEMQTIREDLTPTDYLFTLNRVRRVHYDTVYKMISKVKAIAGLSDRDGIAPHSLRHAAATRLMRNQVDLRAIQAFLGHENIETTAIYLHADEEALRKTASRQSLGIVTHQASVDKRSEGVRVVRRSIRA